VLLIIGADSRDVRMPQVSDDSGATSERVPPSGVLLLELRERSASPADQRTEGLRATLFTIRRNRRCGAVDTGAARNFADAIACVV